MIPESILMVKMVKNIKIMIFQYLHENLNQKVDSISERVPECDFEGPGPQNPRKIQNVATFSKILLNPWCCLIYSVNSSTIPYHSHRFPLHPPSIPLHFPSIPWDLAASEQGMGPKMDRKIERASRNLPEPNN